MPPLATDLFDYPLPSRLIAQHPAPRRDQSRLLVVHRSRRELEHRTFSELPRYLNSGDILFRNNAAVLPARLLAKRPTGGQVECFLLHPVNGQTWRCLVKPGKKLGVGETFSHPANAYSAEVVAREPDGSAVVRFTTPADEPIAAVAQRVGEVPLPPYISRTPTADGTAANQRAIDLERYQTVYAEGAQRVAVAAPTAGLHFTPELLQEVAARGVGTRDVTLHVGLGTFRPITTANVEEHAIHREIYEIPADTQRSLFPPLTGRRIAVGTTTVRTVEDFLSRHTAPVAGEGTHFAEAALFIYPPRLFRGVDALITNFHQPRSTLLCLVAAFLSPGNTDGIEWIRQIYDEAIAREYRFLSYGDAMLIL